MLIPGLNVLPDDHDETIDDESEIVWLLAKARLDVEEAWRADGRDNVMDS
jgi:hypothetical protein